MGAVLGDRYEIGRVLGSGGMGQVREGRDRRLDRRVAVKLVTEGLADATTRARFLREATLAARFTHPHVVTVYDAGEDDGTLYLVMELVQGPTLARVLADRGALDPAEVVAVGDQVLAAVGAAHRNGLVHRDIKPSNILFTEEGVAKLADFGIAKALGRQAAALTATGQIIGTSWYLSPEQAMGREATPPSDLYAVGVVLYEMLTGRRPFDGETPIAIALAHQREPVPPLLERCPGLDPDLAAVVERALAKSPRDRYPDAAAMQAALASPGAAPALLAGLGPAPDQTTVTPTRRPLEAGPGPRSDGRSPRWSRAATMASLSLVAAAAGAATVLLGGGDDRDDPGAAGAASPSVTTPESTTTTAVTTTTAASTTTTTAPATTTTAPPLTVGAVADLLATDPDAYGEKGRDLLDKLQKVQSESPDKQAEEARKAIEEIGKWIDEGELDPTMGQRAISVLEPLAASPGTEPSAGGPAGAGPPSEEDEEDD